MTVKVLKRLIERKPSQISIRCKSGEGSGGKRARLRLHLSTKHPRKPTAKQQPGEKEEERRESSKKKSECTALMRIKKRSGKRKAQLQ